MAAIMGGDRDRAFQKFLLTIVPVPVSAPTCMACGGALLTVTAWLSLPVWPIVSVAVALTVCEPSPVVVVFHEADQPSAPLVSTPMEVSVDEELDLRDPDDHRWHPP